MNKSQYPSYFYELSSQLTGYSLPVLHGTGVGELYFDQLKLVIGETMLGELLDAYQHHTACDSLDHLLQDPQWGPICKNIIKMWYMGNWYQMPDDWRYQYLISPDDVEKVIAAATYIEGLVWKAIGTHPKSAKQPGYGTWATPPSS